MRQDSNIELTRDNDEAVIVPIEDRDSPENDFRIPFPATEDVEYVISQDYDATGVVYEADPDHIDIVEWSLVEPETVDLPADYKTIPADQSVVRIRIPRSETNQLPPTEEPGELVHECRITNDVGQAVTVMQGDIEVLESATAANGGT